jgi:hypothetical protein
MSKLTGIELKCAQLVPSAMFASPTAVVHARGLSIPQKISILRRWEFDARRSAGGVRAGAVSGETLLLEEVQGALAILGVAATPLPDPRIGPARH